MGWRLDTSSDYLWRPTPVVTAYPFTFACWARVKSGSGNLWSIGNTGDDNQYIRATFGTSSTQFSVGNLVEGYVNFSGSTSGIVAVGQWYPVAFVAASATDRRIYLNGEQLASDTATATWPAALTSTALGVLYRTSPGSAFTGSVAHAAFWSAALSAAELGTHARGRRPDTIRPDALVEYWPLSRRRPRAGARRSLDLAVAGSPVFVAGPSALAEQRPAFAPWLAGPAPSAGDGGPTFLGASILSGFLGA